MRTRLLGAAALALVAAHDYALSQHRKRLDELEREVRAEATKAQRERRMLDELAQDFDRLLVVTVPMAAKAPDWLALLETRPGVVGGRANLQAWLTERREAREAGE